MKKTSWKLQKLKLYGQLKSTENKEICKAMINLNSSNLSKTKIFISKLFCAIHFMKILLLKDKKIILYFHVLFI